MGRSRTLPLPLDAAWNLLISQRGLAAWLGEGIQAPLAQGAGYRANDGTRGEVRSLRPQDRVRLTWQPPGREAPATLQVAIVEAASGTSVRFHAERLADAAERERVRDRFAGALDRLAGLARAAR